MPLENQTIGLAGNFIGAVLESAGLVTLSDILLDWQEVLISCSVFTFVIAAIFAIRAGMNGNYARVIYLLLGPIISLAILNTGVQFGYTSVQWGERTPAQSEEAVRAAVEKMIVEANTRGERRVPAFIVIFDRMVSSTIQQVVGFILDTKNNQDVIQAARERVFQRILKAESVDKEYLQLLALSLMGSCAEITSLERELADDRLFTAPPGTVRGDEKAMKLARVEVLKLKRQTLQPVVLKYLQAADIDARIDPTCFEIWTYTAALSLDFAESLLKPDSKLRLEFPELTDENWDDVYDFVKAKLSPVDPKVLDVNEAFRVLAAILLKNSLSGSTLSAFLTQLEGHQDWLIPGEQTSKAETGSFIEESRISATRFAASIPYIQGALLYLLAVGFPVFAILMILPGRSGVILTWCSLWIWVKSWDIGYAIVEVLRNIFWGLLPNVGDSLSAAGLTELNWDDPSAIFYLSTASDPGLEVAAYISALAVLILIVPVASAYLFQGANQFLSIASKGFSNKDSLQRREYRGDTDNLPVLADNRNQNSNNTGARP